MSSLCSSWVSSCRNVGLFNTRPKRAEMKWKFQYFSNEAWPRIGHRGAIEIKVNPNFPQIAFWTAKASHMCYAKATTRCSYPISSNLLFQCVSEDLLCLQDHWIRIRRRRNFNTVWHWFSVRSCIPPEVIAEHLKWLEKAPEVIWLDNDALILTN